MKFQKHWNILIKVAFLYGIQQKEITIRVLLEFLNVIEMKKNLKEGSKVTLFQFFSLYVSLYSPVTLEISWIKIFQYVDSAERTNDNRLSLWFIRKHHSTKHIFSLIFIAFHSHHTQHFIRRSNQPSTNSRHQSPNTNSSECLNRNPSPSYDTHLPPHSPPFFSFCLSHQSSEEGHRSAKGATYRAGLFWPFSRRRSIDFSPVERAKRLLNIYHAIEWLNDGQGIYRLEGTAFHGQRDNRVFRLRAFLIFSKGFSFGRSSRVDRILWRLVRVCFR